MRAIWIAYVVIVAIVFLLIEFPREDVARYYLAQMEAQTGVTLAWSGGEFHFASAHLDRNVMVVRQGQDVLDLDSVDAWFGLGSVDFQANRGTGYISGTYQRTSLDVDMHQFPLPVAGDWLKNVTLSGTGHFVPSEQNGTGNLELRADASPNLSGLGALSVAGSVQVTGDYAVKHGNLELHAALAGDKLHGRLDLMATRVAADYMLAGTLVADLNGQQHTFRISGTANAPHAEMAGASPSWAPPR